MSTLTARNLEIDYQRTGNPAITEIDVTIEKGEFVTIIGPSGCGKSTLLHALGGVIKPTEGGVEANDTALTSPDPRVAAFVFQDYSLFPWKKVLDNVLMGLRFAGVRKSAALATAREELEFVGLSATADQYPAELSGGMQQRVAVARALALKPSWLLMDEPFGALDEQTRRALGRDLTSILHNADQGVVLITHSLEEAIFWADRIVVMEAGPGRIKTEIKVDAPWPRSLDFMTTDQFAETRAELFNLIQPESVSE